MATKETKFRLLDADEIECRVGQGGKDKMAWCSILLYKDARCDMKRLDEVYGTEGWQRHHSLIGNYLVCTISIWDEENKQWVEKSDVGTANKTEPEKSTFSDSFKRAATNIGIGRELYTGPRIFIRLNPEREYDAQGRLKTSFHVAFIGYTTKRIINKLIIVDNQNVVRYIYGFTNEEYAKWVESQKPKDEGKSEAPASEKSTGDSSLDGQLSVALKQIESATDVKQLVTIYNSFTDLQGQHAFTAKLTEKRVALSNKAKKSA
jgi:hypothetical protein